MKKQTTYYLVKGEKKLVNAYNINLEGLVCPLPVAKTKKKLNELQTGDILEVKGDFAEAGENIKRFVESKGHRVLNFDVFGEAYYLKIEKS